MKCIVLFVMMFICSTASAQRQWICTVNVGGKLAYSSVHNTRDQCITRCQQVAYSLLMSSRLPVIHVCNTW